MTSSRSLASGFLRSAERHADRLAIAVEGRETSYAELLRRAASIAATLQRELPETDPPLTAVFAYRTLTAFAGVLGVLLRGHGYVPLNRTFPADRSRVMLERSGCRALIVDSASTAQLDVVLAGPSEGLVILLPEADDARALAARHPRHRFVPASAFASPRSYEPVAVDPDAIAYLLFTSGSTGMPKGVMVAHRNVVPFVDAMVDRYSIGADDRFSQTFDMTFDLSVFDMFVAWERGASVHVPSQRELIQPGRFLRESALSIWFSVPSTGMFMRRLGALKPQSYPSLRWSLFCGEPLPIAVADAWAHAAPNSIVENLYGPTELTIACTLHRFDPGSTPAQAERDLVPIGDPFPGMRELIVDESLLPVDDGEAGELLMTGPQVTLGYWRDAQKTAEAFVVPPGEDEVFYRTGDIVRRPAPGAPMVYLRRRDHQIKVQGHRVELGEIEAVLRRESSVDAVVAVGWPLTEQGAGGVVAFVADPDADAATLRTRCAQQLPPYMVPSEILLRETLPLNANGKFDRRALQSILEERSE